MSQRHKKRDYSDILESSKKDYDALCDAMNIPRDGEEKEKKELEEVYGEDEVFYDPYKGYYDDSEREISDIEDHEGGADPMDEVREEVVVRKKEEAVQQTVSSQPLKRRHVEVVTEEVKVAPTKPESQNGTTPNLNEEERMKLIKRKEQVRIIKEILEERTYKHEVLMERFREDETMPFRSVLNKGEGYEMSSFYKGVMGKSYNMATGIRSEGGGESYGINPQYRGGKKKKLPSMAFANGPLDAKIMIVGEWPGKKELEEGSAFVGPTGKFLRKTLKQMFEEEDKKKGKKPLRKNDKNKKKGDGNRRGENEVRTEDETKTEEEEEEELLYENKVIFANSMILPPPQDKVMTPLAYKKHVEYLKGLLDIVRPKLVITMGRFSSNLFRRMLSVKAMCRSPICGGNTKIDQSSKFGDLYDMKILEMKAFTCVRSPRPSTMPHKSVLRDPEEIASWTQYRKDNSYSFMVVPLGNPARMIDTKAIKPWYEKFSQAVHYIHAPPDPIKDLHVYDLEGCRATFAERIRKAEAELVAMKEKHRDVVEGKKKDPVVEKLVSDATAELDKFKMYFNQEPVFEKFEDIRRVSKECLMPVLEAKDLRPKEDLEARCLVDKKKGGNSDRSFSFHTNGMMYDSLRNLFHVYGMAHIPKESDPAQFDGVSVDCVIRNFEFPFWSCVPQRMIRWAFEKAVQEHPLPQGARLGGEKLRDGLDILSSTRIGGIGVKVKSKGTTPLEREEHSITKESKVTLMTKKCLEYAKRHYKPLYDAFLVHLGEQMGLLDQKIRSKWEKKYPSNVSRGYDPYELSEWCESENPLSFTISLQDDCYDMRSVYLPKDKGEIFFKFSCKYHGQIRHLAEVIKNNVWPEYWNGTVDDRPRIFGCDMAAEDLLSVYSKVWMSCWTYVDFTPKKNSLDCAASEFLAHDDPRRTSNYAVYIETVCTRVRSFSPIEPDVIANKELQAIYSKHPFSRLEAFDAEMLNRMGVFPKTSGDPVIVVANEYHFRDPEKFKVNPKGFSNLSELHILVAGWVAISEEDFRKEGVCPPWVSIHVHQYMEEIELLLAQAELMRTMNCQTATCHNGINFDIDYFENRLFMLSVIARKLPRPGKAARDLELGERARGFRCSQDKDACPYVKRKKFASRAYGEKLVSSLVEPAKNYIDTLDYFTREKKLPSYTLNALAETFLKSLKHDVPYVAIPGLYVTDPITLALLILYGGKDTVLTGRLFNREKCEVSGTEFSRILRIITPGRLHRGGAEEKLFSFIVHMIQDQKRRQYIESRFYNDYYAQLKGPLYKYVGEILKTGKPLEAYKVKNILRTGKPEGNARFRLKNNNEEEDDEASLKGVFGAGCRAGEGTMLWRGGSSRSLRMREYDEEYDNRGNQSMSSNFTTECEVDGVSITHFDEDSYRYHRRRDDPQNLRASDLRGRARRAFEDTEALIMGTERDEEEEDSEDELELDEEERREAKRLRINEIIENEGDAEALAAEEAEEAEMAWKGLYDDPLITDEDIQDITECVDMADTNQNESSGINSNNNAKKDNNSPIKSEKRSSTTFKSDSESSSLGYYPSASSILLNRKKAQQEDKFRKEIQRQFDTSYVQSTLRGFDERLLKNRIASQSQRLFATPGIVNPAKEAIKPEPTPPFNGVVGGNAAASQLNASRLAPSKSLFVPSNTSTTTAKSKNLQCKIDSYFVSTPRTNFESGVETKEFTMSALGSNKRLYYLTDAALQKQIKATKRQRTKQDKKQQDIIAGRNTKEAFIPKTVKKAVEKDTEEEETASRESGYEGACVIDAARDFYRIRDLTNLDELEMKNFQPKVRNFANHTTSALLAELTEKEFTKEQTEKRMKEHQIRGVRQLQKQEKEKENNPATQNGFGKVTITDEKEEGEEKGEEEEKDKGPEEHINGCINDVTPMEVEPDTVDAKGEPKLKPVTRRPKSWDQRCTPEFFDGTLDTIDKILEGLSVIHEKILEEKKKERIRNPEALKWQKRAVHLSEKRRFLGLYKELLLSTIPDSVPNPNTNPNSIEFNEAIWGLFVAMGPILFNDFKSLYPSIHQSMSVSHDRVLFLSDFNKYPYKGRVFPSDCNRAQVDDVNPRTGVKEPTYFLKDYLIRWVLVKEEEERIKENEKTAPTPIPTTKEDEEAKKKARQEEEEEAVRFGNFVCDESGESPFIPGKRKREEPRPQSEEEDGWLSKHQLRKIASMLKKAERLRQEDLNNIERMKDYAQLKDVAKRIKKEGRRREQEVLKMHLPKGYVWKEVKINIGYGVIAEAVRLLVQLRNQTRGEQKKFDPKCDVDWHILEGRQLALKTLANAIYGSTGATFGRLGWKAIGSNICAFGRVFLFTSIAALREAFGACNVFIAGGDTDSNMSQYSFVFNEYQAAEMGPVAIQFVNAKFQDKYPTEQDFEKFQYPMATSVKKRYGGAYYADGETANGFFGKKRFIEIFFGEEHWPRIFSARKWWLKFKRDEPQSFDTMYEWKEELPHDDLSDPALNETAPPLADFEPYFPRDKDGKPTMKLPDPIKLPPKDVNKNTKLREVLMKWKWFPVWNNVIEDIVDKQGEGLKNKPHVLIKDCNGEALLEVTHLGNMQWSMTRRFKDHTNYRFRRPSYQTFFKTNDEESIKKANELVGDLLCKYMNEVVGNKSLGANTYLGEYKEEGTGLKVTVELACDNWYDNGALFEKAGWDDGVRKCTTVRDKYLKTHGARVWVRDWLWGNRYEIPNFDLKILCKMFTRGFETVRRDSCPYTRDMMNKFLQKTLIEEQIANAILGYVEDSKKMLYGEVDTSMLICSKQYSKPLEAYKAASASHLAIVQRARSKGETEPEIGSRVSYIIVRKGGGKAGGKLSDRAYSPEEVVRDNMQIDYEHYFTKMIARPFEKLLQIFVSNYKYLVTPDCLVKRSYTTQIAADAPLMKYGATRLSKCLMCNAFTPAPVCMDCQTSIQKNYKPEDRKALSLVINKEKTDLDNIMERRLEVCRKCTNVTSKDPKAILCQHTLCKEYFPRVKSVRQREQTFVSYDYLLNILNDF